MVASDKLFQLIKSLTMAEKVFVKRDASLYKKGKMHNYLKLFDAIDKQTEYDEAAILKKFEKEKFTNNFSVAKNYLCQFILKSLKNHLAELKPRDHAETLINEALEFSKRSLYKEALKYLEKARKISEDAEIYDMLYRILQMENTWLKAIGAKGYREQTVTNFETSALIAQKMENLARIASLQHKVMYLGQVIGTAHNPAERKEWMEITSNPMIGDEQMAISVFARYLQLDIKFIKHMIFSEYTTAFDISEQILKLWEGHPELRLQKQVEYMRSLGYHLIVCHTLHRYELFDEVLNTISAIKPTEARNEVTRFQTYYNLKIIQLAGTSELDELDTVVSEINKGLKRYKIRSSRLWLIQYNLSVLYIAKQQFDVALDWLNKSFDHDNLDFNDFKIRTALLVNLIIHYELGNIGLLQHNIIAAERKFKQLDQFYEFEKIFLKLIKKAIKVYNTIEEKNAFQTLLEEFKKRTGNSHLPSLTGHFDYAIWLESRIRGMSMVEIWKENIKKEAKVGETNN